MKLDIGHLWTDDEIVAILESRGYKVVKTTETFERSWLEKYEVSGQEDIEIFHVVKDGKYLTEHWHYAGQYYFARVERFFFKEILKPALTQLMRS